MAAQQIYHTTERGPCQRLLSFKQSFLYFAQRQALYFVKYPNLHFPAAYGKL